MQGIPKECQEKPKHLQSLPPVITVNNYSAVVGMYTHTHTHTHTYIYIYIYIWYEFRYMECQEPV